MRVVEFPEPETMAARSWRKKEWGLAFNNITVVLFSETRLSVAQAGP